MDEALRLYTQLGEAICSFKELTSLEQRKLLKELEATYKRQGETIAQGSIQVTLEKKLHKMRLTMDTVIHYRTWQFKITIFQE